MIKAKETEGGLIEKPNKKDKIKKFGKTLLECVLRKPPSLEDLKKGFKGGLKEKK